MNAQSTSVIQVEDLRADSEPLRLAVVTETYPPEVNGVAMTLAQLVGGLQARGHHIQLIRPRQASTDEADSGERFHEVLMRGVKIPNYPNLRMGVPSKRHLVRLWSTRRPDVVHIATEGPLGWSALQASRYLKLPVTSDFRTNFHAYSRHYGIGWLKKPIMAYLRKFHNATQRTFVPTEALRVDLEACRFQSLRVIGRGVDTGLFNPSRRDPRLRSQWGASESTLVLLCVSRLAAEKNLDLLVEAYQSLVRQVPDSRMVFVGDGPMRASLKARLPQAIFAGVRQGSDLAAHYASADMFAFPSLTETFGNVTAEGLASGLPVVAFDYAAASHLIRDGLNGRLVPFADSLSFIQAVVDLGADRQRCATQGAHARRTALGFGWDAVVADFEKQLRQVIVEKGVADAAYPASTGLPSPVR